MFECSGLQWWSARGSILCYTGTDEERGLAHWKNMRAALSKAHTSPKLRERLSASYDLPYVMGALRRWKWLRYVPFCPTYGMTDSTVEATNTQTNGSLHCASDV